MINHIFKYYVYKTRENGSLDLKVLKGNILKIKNIEKQITLNKPEKWEKNWTKMETIVRKQITRILKYMVVRQLGWERGNVVVVVVSPLQYIVTFYTSCVIFAVLKTGA